MKCYLECGASIVRIFEGEFSVHRQLGSVFLKV